MRCDQCKFWDNERETRPFHKTFNDDGPYPGDERVGYCMAASNYSWGRHPQDRKFGCEPPKMMPTDWTGFHAILYTRNDYGCTTYQTRELSRKKP